MARLNVEVQLSPVLARTVTVPENEFLFGDAGMVTSKPTIMFLAMEINGWVVGLGLSEDTL
jgi:hypothetical protein